MKKEKFAYIFHNFEVKKDYPSGFCNDLSDLLS